MHVRYLRELHAGDPVRVTFQLLDFDAKRLHYFEQLFHAEQGWLSATSENMALHVDYGGEEDRRFSARGRGAPRPHEGRACRPADAARRGAAHRHDGRAMTAGP